MSSAQELTSEGGVFLGSSQERAWQRWCVSQRCVEWSGQTFLERGYPKATARVLCFWAVQDEYPAKMVCCSVLAILVHTNVVYVLGSGLDLTEFVCFSVVARRDVAKKIASGSPGRSVYVEAAGVECGWTYCRCVKKVQKMMTGFGAPREVC